MKALRLIHRNVNTVGNLPCVTPIHVIRKNMQLTIMTIIVQPVKNVSVSVTGGFTLEENFDQILLSIPS